MNIRLKKYLLASFLVLAFGATAPVTAETETQILQTTEATNKAIVNLEAALKALNENKLDEARDYVDATRDSAIDILGRCSIESKKERGSTALRKAHRQIRNGNAAGAKVSLKKAIEIFKSLQVSVENTEQPGLLKWFK